MINYLSYDCPNTSEIIMGDDIAKLGNYLTETNLETKFWIIIMINILDISYESHMDNCVQLLRYTVSVI